MFNIKGNEWVDLFGVVFIARLLAVLWGFPALTLAEAGIWGTTIASFAATKFGGPKT